MQVREKSKKEYRKKNNFKINIFFNEDGENFENIVENAFEIYCKKNNNMIYYE